MLLNKIFKHLYNAGDKLEDKVRGRLSHYPLIYAFIGGVGVVLFWRGVWHTFDSIMEFLSSSGENLTTTGQPGLPWWDGPLSVLLGTTLLLVVGLFVSNFIGNEIIISGIKKEKKIVEKTEEELDRDLKEKSNMKTEIHDIDSRVKRIDEAISKHSV